MERDSYIFYRSFRKATKYFSKEDRCDFYDVLCDYSLDGTLPDLDSMPPIVAAVLVTVIPQIDANNKRYIDGCKGGRPKKTSGFQVEEPNENENVNDNVNEKENENENTHTREFSRCFPNKLIDCSFDDDKYNMNRLIALIRMSDFLKTVEWPLSTYLKHYDKIIAGAYKDYKPTSQQNNNRHSATDDELLAISVHMDDVRL